MKRILIIILASIFMVNILPILAHAEQYTVTPQETTINATSEQDYALWRIPTINWVNEKTYQVKVNVPEVTVNNLRKILLTIEYGTGAFSGNSIQIEYPSTEITLNESAQSYITIEDITLEDRTYNIKFTWKKQPVNSSISYARAMTLTYYSENKGETFTLSKLPEFNISEYREPTPGDILIENVANAPKDVLREVVAVLPVLITVIITFIATRKGIAFVRSILESA